MSYDSTLLPQTNDPLEVQKGMLDLLSKINEVSESIPGASTESTTIDAVLQTVQNHSIAPLVYVRSATRASAVVIDALTIQLLAKGNNSSFEYEAVIAHETEENTVFILERGVNNSWVEIGSADPAGARPNGIISTTFDGNQDSTPQIVTIKYIDSGFQCKAGDTVGYRVKMFDLWLGGSFYLNRTIADANTATMERTTSNVILKERNTLTIGNGQTVITASEEVQNFAKKMVAPGDAPIYGCRAWVNFDGTTAANLAGTYSQTGTVVTVTAPAHGHIPGHVIYIDATSGALADGVYTVVSVFDANTFTVAAGSATTSGNLNLLRRAIRASGNVASVAFYGTGDYGLNFSVAMPDAYYSMGMACRPKDTGTVITMGAPSYSAFTQTAHNFRLCSIGSSAALVSSETVMAQAFR